MSSYIEYIVAAFKAAKYEGFPFSYISPPLEQRVHIPFSFSAVNVGVLHVFKEI